jgi:hypothetical protein
MHQGGALVEKMRLCTGHMGVCTEVHVSFVEMYVYVRVCTC